MTPKEKAEELVDKFYQTTPNEAWINEPVGLSEEYKAWKQAKECALIAVDEIMNVCPFIGIEFATSEGGKESDAKEYWQEVKQELEKL